MGELSFIERKWETLVLNFQVGVVNPLLVVIYQSFSYCTHSYQIWSGICRFVSKYGQNGRITTYAVYSIVQAEILFLLFVFTLHSISVFLNLLHAKDLTFSSSAWLQSVTIYSIYVINKALIYINIV